MKNNKIAVIGLGYVGLTFAISLAKVGFEVLGIENNEKIFKSMLKGKAQFYEENIDKFLIKTQKNKRLKIENNLDNVKKCKTVFITLGTPVNDNKKINLKNLFNLINELKNKLNNRSILVLRSTVKIGTTKKIENILNKNKKIFLAMCPERTAEGSALKEIHYLPQIIGCGSDYVKKELGIIFKKITKKIIFFNSYKEAEILKLIDNSYRDTIFGFANELARIGEYYNIDILNVIDKIKIDYPRSNIALPGTVGGPCLTKDPHILVESVKNKLNLPIISSARHTNENLTIEILKMIKTKLNKRITKILVCGVAFKGLPTTSDIRGSLATEVIKQTKKLFYNPRIDVLDKYVSEEDAKKINNDSKFFKNFESINEKYNFILILNNSHYWKDVGYKKFSNKLFNKGIIYDFWSSFKKDKYKKNYFRFGGGDLFS
ncbi:nucleotide sugar dehydrogenase [Candidatus Pelagibacter sp.]|jgi:UDP-N-acetyl-D-mannosaminuronic acid dehydrogenase|nr:nucleotide sugar dehydrogenase [Candidatus Pelagibacter sp.]